jgi:hypothetical protein
MVPIVGRRHDGRKALFYGGRRLPKRPVASLRMRNEAGLAPAHGLVMAIEASDQAGEAMLPFNL